VTTIYRKLLFYLNDLQFPCISVPFHHNLVFHDFAFDNLTLAIDRPELVFVAAAAATVDIGFMTDASPGQTLRVGSELPVEVHNRVRELRKGSPCTSDAS